MITLKITTEKANKQFFIIPSAMVDYSDKAEKATIDLFFGWLNGILGVSINWTREAKNSAPNGNSNGAKCD